MWTQSKDLHNLVENTINSQQEDSLVDFEKALKKHRSDFSALLKHPVMIFLAFFNIFIALTLILPL
jgi:hypothetical protein